MTYLDRDITAEEVQVLFGGRPDSYDHIAEKFGEVIADATLGAYQGDNLYLLRDGDMWGVLVCGYGSCSGCDALEGCEGDEDVARLVNDLRGDVVWGSRADALAYVTSEWRGFSYYSDSPDGEAFWKECAAALGCVEHDDCKSNAALAIACAESREKAG